MTTGDLVEIRYSAAKIVGARGRIEGPVTDSGVSVRFNFEDACPLIFCSLDQLRLVSLPELIGEIEP